MGKQATLFLMLISIFGNSNSDAGILEKLHFTDSRYARTLNVFRDYCIKAYKDNLLREHCLNAVRTKKEGCKEIDWTVDKETNKPDKCFAEPGNQGNLPWCVAWRDAAFIGYQECRTARELYKNLGPTSRSFDDLNLYSKFHVSPLGIAMGVQKSDFKGDIKTFNLGWDATRWAGDVPDGMEEAIPKNGIFGHVTNHGYCSESRIAANFTGKSDKNKIEVAIDLIGFFKRNVSRKATVEDRKKFLQIVFPDLKESELEKISKEWKKKSGDITSSEDALFMNVVGSICKDENSTKLLNSYVRKAIAPGFFSKPDHIAFHDALERGPVPITAALQDVLWKQGENSGNTDHAMLIVGRSWIEDKDGKGGCVYKVRNSWGAKCPSDRDPPPPHANLVTCNHDGYVYIPEEVLMRPGMNWTDYRVKPRDGADLSGFLKGPTASGLNVKASKDGPAD